MSPVTEYVRWLSSSWVCYVEEQLSFKSEKAKMICNWWFQMLHTECTLCALIISLSHYQSFRPISNGIGDYQPFNGIIVPKSPECGRDGEPNRLKMIFEEVMKKWVVSWNITCFNYLLVQSCQQRACFLSHTSQTWSGQVDKSGEQVLKFSVIAIGLDCCLHWHRDVGEPYPHASSQSSRVANCEHLSTGEAIKDFKSVD